MELTIMIFALVFIMLVVPYTYLNKDTFLLKAWWIAVIVTTVAWIAVVVKV